METPLINSYYKTTVAINQLFQKAFDTLAQYGYAEAAAFFEEAFRYDPYRLEAHYILAIHFAAVNDTERFKEHFFICCNIDPAYREKIVTSPTVINAPDSVIAEIVAAKTSDNVWCRRSFKSIEPANDGICLIFKPDQKKAIRDLYVTWEESTTQYFEKHKRNGEPPNIYEEYVTPDFEQLDYFILDHESVRDVVDCPPEALYTALQRLSEYIDNNVRFLVISHWDEFIDEIIIRNGVFHIYRHQTGPGIYYAQLAYFETIVASHPEDQLLRRFLCSEYQQAILTRIKYDYLGDAIEYLHKAISLSAPEDPWMPYILGKIALDKGDRETALHYFKEAATTAPAIFDVNHELGILQIQYSKEYAEGIGHLTAALQIRPYTDIYAWRALAFLQLNMLSAADADIDAYIDKIAPHNNSSFIFAGRLLAEAGFKSSGDRLLNAGLEKNQLHESELRAKREKDADPEKAFYNSQLTENARHRASLYTCLSINAVSPAERYNYAEEALRLNETDPQLLFNIGVVLYGQGRILEAEGYYDRALAQDGNFINALNNKSIIRMQYKDYTTALTLTDRLLAIDKTYAEAFSTKAIIAYNRGELALSLTFYEEYLARNPSSGKGQYGVGFIYSHLGEDEKAIPYLQKAIELSPGNEQLNEMYSNLANCYNNTGQLTAAIEAAKASITIKPDYYHPYYMLACIYVKLGRSEEALEMVSKALQLDPSQRNQIINEPDLIELKEKMTSLTA